MPYGSTALADPASPLGMMQRGRGAAFLWARDQPPTEVVPVLLACLRTDPRWDPQIEEREFLYIEVAALAGMDPAPLVEIAEDIDGDLYPEASSYTAAEVLAGLAARGDGRAHAALLDTITEGRNWPDAVSLLIDWGLMDGIEERLVARLEADGAARDVLLGEWGYPAHWDQEPWTAWRGRHPVVEAIASAVEEAGEGAGEPRTGGDPSIEAILGTGGDLEAALERAAAVLSAPWQRGVTRVVWRFVEDSPGDAALHAARRWADSADERLVRLGWSLLGDRATAEDVPRLAAALEPSLDAGDMYRLCNALKGLATVPGAGPHPGAERAFREAPYAFARRYAAELLAATDPAFPSGLAVECLWDGDHGVRDVGIEAVDRSVPGVAARLASMPEDRP